MSCSKLSTTEKFPVSVRMKIPKEKLLIENQKDEWQILSEDYFIQGLPAFSYFVGIRCETFENNERFNGRCLFLLLGFKKENKFKMKFSCKVTLPASNNGYTWNVDHKIERPNCAMRIPGLDTESLFDPTMKWFVNDIFVFMVEATFTVEREKCNGAIHKNEISKCCECGLSLKLWDRNDKDFAFVVDGKEIKVHKLVVETKSPEWKQMIQKKLSDSSDAARIAITDFDYETR
uniref:BTB domain-containing protein n=1 Tax=Panagrolaimus davidi TaxID=227884 RepID=A0A914QJW8_9BILA